MSPVRLALFLALTLPAVTPIRATTVVAPPEELRGINTVRLIMHSYCGYDAFQEALNVIRPEVERHLREAGLHVERRDEMLPPGRTPQLQIDVECAAAGVDAKNGLFVSAGPHDPALDPFLRGHVFLVHVHLFQPVVLESKPRLRVVAPTYSWHGSLTGEAKSRPFTELRREALRGLEQFIGAWRSAQTMGEAAPG